MQINNVYGANISFYNVTKTDKKTKKVNTSFKANQFTPLYSDVLKGYYLSSLKQNNSQLVSFLGKTKEQQFKKLPLEEQVKLEKLFEELLHDEKNLLLTAIGKKPGAYTGINNEFIPTLLKYKSLIESDNIKFIVEDAERSKGQTFRRVFFFNLKEAKKTIDDNIGYLRLRLNDMKLSSDQILDMVLSPETPLFNITNNHDLIGIMLGFPTEDNFMFKISSEIDDMLIYLNAKGLSDSKQAKTLAALYNIVRPDLKGHMNIPFDKINAIIDDLDLPRPKVSFPKTHFYRFISWDKESKAMKAIDETIKSAEPIVNEKLSNPYDLMHHFLKDEKTQPLTYLEKLTRPIKNLFTKLFAVCTKVYNYIFHRPSQAG